MILYPGVKEHISLAQFNTTGVGGPARYFYQTTSRADLLGVLDWAEQEKIYYVVIGHGSNLLASDAGFAGLVIRNEATGFSIKEIKKDDVKTEQALVTVEAGTPLSPFINQLAQLGWGGLENMAGIPGTVGGAVWGNAGCYGINTADVIHSVLVWQEGGKLATVPASDLDYKYRCSILREHPYWVVIAATYLVKSASAKWLHNQIRYILNRRQAEKPVGRSCGSYFKNPTSDSSAGKLIDTAGLKGFQIGGVRVSSQHANYFINDGHSTCEDVLTLADVVKRKIYEQYSIKLEEEVVLLAEKPDSRHNRAQDHTPKLAKFC